jgi:hypothetical protein
MNRLAVVLAADSATTVTRATSQGEEERYFKGANKIFQLSDQHPVGLMIFDSADLLSVPWEIVIKCFRRQLGDQSFNDLVGYANEFFNYLSDDRRLFPDDVRRTRLVDVALRVALRAIVPAEETKPEDFAASAAAEIEQLAAAVDASAYPDGIDDAFAKEAVATILGELVERIELYRKHLPEAMPEDVGRVAELAVRTVLQDPGEYFGTTGLVFAGYGEHDVFPQMIEFSGLGILLGRHVAVEVSSMKIDYDVPAWMRAFAQTSMSDTFTLGMSGDVYSSVMKAVGSGLEQVASEVCEAAGVAPAELKDLESILDRGRSRISKSVLDEARDQHATPMRSILGVLPIDEMAELAETLINLQSLKEKVTRPSETVGGPVDVAVITKSEGLIWMKRKHYFKPELNSRYLARQAAALKD